MAEFVYDRDDMTVVVLRIPRRLWDRWEYRHRHFGAAIHALRESCIAIISERELLERGTDQGDPFWRG